MVKGAGFNTGGLVVGVGPGVAVKAWPPNTVTGPGWADWVAFLTLFFVSLPSNELFKSETRG